MAASRDPLATILPELASLPFIYQQGCFQTYKFSNQKFQEVLLQFGNKVPKPEQPKHPVGKLWQSCCSILPGDERALEVLVIKGAGDTDAQVVTP